MDQILTLEALRVARRFIKPARPIVVGVACSPAIHQRLQPVAADHAHLTCPILVDPRLNLAEVYHDREAWMERCEEQRAWDGPALEGLGLDGGAGTPGLESAAE